MRGQFMLAGWKNMHPDVQYAGKFIDLYQHIEDKSYIRRTERFERWYENPIDLPGHLLPPGDHVLFRENLLRQGELHRLGQHH